MITKVAPFTSRGYIKVCSMSSGELDQWTLDRSRTIPRRCGICHPPSSDRSPSARSESADQIMTITKRSANLPTGKWRADGPSDSQREAWLWADRYIPFDKLSPDDLAARTDLRRRLGSLRAEPGEILEASYQGPKPPKADLGRFPTYKRLEQTWAAIHRTEVVVAGYANGPSTPFAILLDLVCPRSATAVAGPELVKALINGAVSAFHAHVDLASLPEIARRIAVTTGQHPENVAVMLTNVERAVLGRNDKLAFERGDGVQWNPGDHMCMVGQVTIAQSVGESWKLSGQVHELQPR